MAGARAAALGIQEMRELVPYSMQVLQQRLVACNGGSGSER